LEGDQGKLGGHVQGEEKRERSRERREEKDRGNMRKNTLLALGFGRRRDK